MTIELISRVPVIGPLSTPQKRQLGGLKNSQEPEKTPEESVSKASPSKSRSRSRSRSRTSSESQQAAAEVLPTPQFYDKSFSDDCPAIDFRTPLEWLSFITGILILLACLVPVGSVLLAAMVWEACDRGWAGGFTQSGKELSGFLCGRVGPAFTSFTQKFNERFVKKPHDAYMINCMVIHGFFVPAMFLGCAWRVYTTRTVELWLCYIYHVLRIGPFFMNFAFVYTLCHKEGHSRTGLFKQPYNSSTIMRNWFNWWVGMFYGVLPATFAYGHSINHHRYNNGPKDVVTTSDKPRDSFANWVAYLPRWFLYACNATTIVQFAVEDNMKVVVKVIWGTLYSVAWVYLCAWKLGWLFALGYVVFPFFEAGILLAAVNWSWHAFIDPLDPENEYVQSITIFDGSVNVLNEDAHVVHHQYPGCHWSDHPKQVERHWDAYYENRASVFRGTHAFEIFGMSVARDYEAMAEKFVDLYGESTGKPLSQQQRVDLIKQRLRACWWGPRADPKWAQRVSSRIDPKSAIKSRTR